jgi:hypothetical protein
VQNLNFLYVLREMQKSPWFCHFCIQVSFRFVIPLIIFRSEAFRGQKRSGNSAVGCTVGC